MNVRFKHSWNVTVEEARELQSHLKNEIDVSSRLYLSSVKIVAAADISFNKYENLLYAAVVLVHFPDLETISVHRIKTLAGFPYIPGYLSFREAPPIIEIFRQIKIEPDVLLCDGQGIAHPRAFGLASHLGLLLDIPSIGCAKSLLVGEFQKPGLTRGSASDLIYDGKTVGRVLRTRDHVKPIFVSTGHKVNISDALQLVLSCCPRYRIPEPIRQAHLTVNELRKEDKIQAAI
jgi:deoxyribonuclease V